MNEKKNKTMSVYRLIYILIPKKPAFANSRGPWGEGRNEENRKEKDIFSAFHSSSAFLLLNFLSPSLFAMENVFQLSHVSGPFTQLQGRVMDRNLKKSAICLIVCDSVPLGPVPERPISANP